MNPIKIIIVGAGSRGSHYAEFTRKHPHLAQVVGVAEPREYYRNRLAQLHQIPANQISTDWRPLAEKVKFADAVIIATPDVVHVEPAIAFANLGYHILLEKPMALNFPDCQRIVDAVLANDVVFSVGHVLRYTAYTQKVKSILDAGVIGEVVSLQHLEPVGYWHHAHSFVRGNWRNDRQSTFMLLSKSCHDLDWIQYIVGARCQAISSFGSLKHFRPEQRPATAGERCVACEFEPQCPYSALKIYLGRLKAGKTGWPVDVLAPEATEASLMEALTHGPYGRCVYACDNNVVDHQVVNMIFENDVSATFTMTAFTEATDRRTRIFGTKGELEGSLPIIQHYDFLTDQKQIIDIRQTEPNLAGHGGGDDNLILSFITAIAKNDKSQILSGPLESLESHRMVFAAETARVENRVVEF